MSAGILLTRIRYVVDVGRVSRVSETPKSCAIQVGGKRLIARDEHVDAHVKLLSSDEQRVEDVPVRKCVN